MSWKIKTSRGRGLTCAGPALRNFRGRPGGGLWTPPPPSNSAFRRLSNKRKIAFEISILSSFCRQKPFRNFFVILFFARVNIEVTRGLISSRNFTFFRKYVFITETDIGRRSQNGAIDSCWAPLSLKCRDLSYLQLVRLYTSKKVKRRFCKKNANNFWTMKSSEIIQTSSCSSCQHRSQHMHFDLEK